MPNFRFVLRVATTAEWTAADPVLLRGEPGWDSDQQTLKVGDGTSHWSELAGESVPSSITSVNGQTGPAVVLTSTDVGAQPASAELTAIAAQTSTEYGRGLLTLIDQAALTALLPAATAGTAGVTTLASDAEAVAGNDSTKAVTPASLAARVSALIDTTVALGTSNTVVPSQNAVRAYVNTYAQPISANLTSLDGVAATTYGRNLLTLADQTALGAAVGSATTTAQGIVELATNAETTTGTDATRAVTPAGLAAALSGLSGGGNVSGPASSVSGNVATFSGTTGKIIQDSGVTLGTAASLDVPTSGDATSGQVVKGSDTRLTDSRTPTAHVHPESDITNLTTDLANKQPLDTDLTAIAALVSAADKVPYATGAGTWALATQTSFARTLLDDTDAATARGTLGLGGAATLAVGTATGTVAAGDDSRIVGAAQKASNLSDLADAATARTNLGLGGAATLSVGTTAGTVAAGDDARITGAAQKANNLSDLASATTARTNLGLGDAAVRTAQSFADSTLGGDETAAAASGTSGTVTLDCSVASVFTLSPTGNVTTLTLSNPPASGRACTITLIVTQSGTVRTIAAPTGARWIGTQPTQVASKASVLTYMTTDGGANWFCSGGVQA